LSNGTWQMAVLDNSGKVYLCGLDKGMICTGGSFIHNGDKALSDNLAYTLSIPPGCTLQYRALPLEIVQAIIKCCF